MAWSGTFRRWPNAGVSPWRQDLRVYSLAPLPAHSLYFRYLGKHEHQLPVPATTPPLTDDLTCPQWLGSIPLDPSQVALTRAFYLNNRITAVGGGGAFSPFSPFRKLVFQPGVVVHTFNPSVCEAGAGGFCDGGLPGLLSKTLSQSNKTAVFSTTHFFRPLWMKITGLCIGLCIFTCILKLMSNVYF